MYSYTFDSETGGLLLNSTPTSFSKEPRPVYASEMDMLGFNQYWDYAKQNDVPYMWAESNIYWYRGVQLAKIKGGDLYNKPELIPSINDNGIIPFNKESGYKLTAIDVKGMCIANSELVQVIEDSTVKKIVKEYEKFKNKLDIFHVAFSGGKDSAVLLDLVKKALPKNSYVVIFGDTGMEFPDTYIAVEKTKKMCELESIPFYESHSKFNPLESWKIFGPPARVLRWCCSVHKSTPQTLKMREITGKDNYTGLDFVGVRAYESIARSKYDYESFGKKQKGQYSFNPILEWTSAEIWIYIFTNNIIINDAYKKGNSRAGCLFCPMGGGRGDYLQYTCYTDDVEQYVDIIKSLNSRNAGNQDALNSYVCNGGWNARKNGRDLTINKPKYLEDVKDGKFIITVINPNVDWKEWIKTLGDLPFAFDINPTKDGYKVILDNNLLKLYPALMKNFRQVFRKAAYCVGCQVCQTNCKNGCISFKNGLSISNCLHCGQCHEIPSGCLLYHSLKISLGEGNMKQESINSFANHAPKPDWVQEFFDLGNEYWEEGNNSLGPNQVPMFKKFLKACGLIDNKSNLTTPFFDIVSQFGWRSKTTWGLILSNLAYNAQCRWYIENMETGMFYDRSHISDLLVSEGVKKDDATSIINAFKRFCDLPLGTELNWGFVEEKGKQIDTLSRTKCDLEDNRILLYSLYKFMEKCECMNEFHISYLYDNDIEKDGISPVKIFGLYDETELMSKLLGLTSVYPDFINATFTNDLKTITLRDKTSNDVLLLFKGE